MLIPIDEPLDPRIEPYRAVRERDLVGRGERFIAEGEVVLRVLMTRSRFETESVLVAENRLQAVEDLIAASPDTLPVYVASRRVMEAIVGFPIHRGVLAVGRRSSAIPVREALARLPVHATVVGLIGLANHDNVGGIFRNAAAFGVDCVLIDRTTCDPLYRKAIRVSVGGSLIVPFAGVADAAAMVEELGHSGFECLSLTPSGRQNLTEVRPSGRTAVLLGAEGSGLPPDILARPRPVAIPMAAGFDSLNVATTSGIVLHHLSVQAGASP